MKNGRTISIKDPKLQKIRNNLRLIILKACSKKKSEISDQKHNKNGNYISPNDDTMKILQDLTDEWWEIERPLRASIVKCASCGKHDRDMTYYRKSCSWYCVHCYKASFD